MAKLSELKKVELLENVVLSGSIAETARIMEEHAPFEFTARALGYAARFCGAEMVKCLLDHGATFAYEAVPAFVKKYATKVAISNIYSYNVDYSLYLLRSQKIDPVPDGVQILDDAERVKVMELLHTEAEKAAVNEADILYYSILYGDSAIREACAKLGIRNLSDYRVANIRCDVNYAHMDGLDRHFRDEFTWTLRRADEENFKHILMDILPMLGEKQIQMMPADLYFSFTDKKKFFENYCAEGLFEMAAKHTNLLEKVKKWDLVCGLVSKSNLSGLDWALKEKWVSKAKELEALLEHAQSISNAAAIACIMEHINKSPAKKAKSASSELGGNPLSVTELKKIWSYKKLDDGSLKLTSYKGSEVDVQVPAVIGKNPVTAIGEYCFSPKAVTSIPQEVREYRYKITSVTIPEGITVIEDNAFHDCVNLTRVALPESLQSIGVQSFVYCAKLEPVQLPQKVQLGRGAFSGCRAMADENGFIIVQGELHGYVGTAEQIRLPDGVVRVRMGAISGKDKLTAVVFSKDTVEIEERAVNFCNNLRMVGIYPATEIIARSAFGNARVKVVGWSGTEAEKFAQAAGFPFQAQNNKT